MFILPFPKSPGEHGAEDDPVGLIARIRRSFPLNMHMGVNGFIVAALLIQAVSIAGVIPTEVWLAKPGYAFTVCIGLVTLSACILFSLRSLLMQPLHDRMPVILAEAEYDQWLDSKTPIENAAKRYGALAAKLEAARTRSNAGKA